MAPNWLVGLGVVLGVASLAPGAAALEFFVTLPPSAKRCFGEFVQKGVLYTAGVEVQNYNNATAGLSVFVQDPSVTVYSEAQRETFRTAFTAVHTGAHHLCVENTAPRAAAEAKLSIAWGAEAKDYNQASWLPLRAEALPRVYSRRWLQVAKKGHLDEATTSLTYMEDLVKAYHRGLIYLRSREARMRKTTDTIARRLVMAFVANLAIVALGAAVQLLYFRAFFRSKKII